MPSPRAFPAPFCEPLPVDPQVVVRATTGLEQLLACEVTKLGHIVDGLSKRQLVVSPVDGSILTHPPRLADDLFLVVAETPDPGSYRTSLVEAVDALEVDGSRFAASPPSRAFAVSASFTGRRNYSRFDIEDAIGRTLSRYGVGEYVSRRGGVVPPRGAAQWRVTFDGSTMRLGLRPFTVPLHRRPWRTRTVVGSLHPPVAAAMVRLADIKKNDVVLDPCCGAGTILIEAHTGQPEARFLGSDHDSQAVATAAHNSTGRTIDWHVGDAGCIAVSSGSVNRIVTNPPWGVRRRAGDLTRFLTNWHRAIRPDGLLVALMGEAQKDALATHPGWDVTATYPVSVAGRHPRIILARPR